MLTNYEIDPRIPPAPEIPGILTSYRIYSDIKLEDGVIHALGNIYQDRFDSNTTHLITTEEHYNAMTENVLKALSQECYLLTKDWLLDTLTTRGRRSTDSYDIELKNEKLLNGYVFCFNAGIYKANAARIQRALQKVPDKFKNALDSPLEHTLKELGDFHPLTIPNLIHKIQELGGAHLTRYTNGVNIILASEDEFKEDGFTIREAKDQGVPIVDYEWLFKVLETGENLPLSPWQYKYKREKICCMLTAEAMKNLRPRNLRRTNCG
jgi:hypothetical protein